jgi:hypothetical protein
MRACGGDGGGGGGIVLLASHSHARARPRRRQVVYVMHASLEGEILTQLPAAGEGGRRPDWLLVDGQQVRGNCGR